MTTAAPNATKKKSLFFTQTVPLFKRFAPYFKPYLPTLVFDLSAPR